MCLCRALKCQIRSRKHHLSKGSKRAYQLDPGNVSQADHKSALCLQLPGRSHKCALYPSHRPITQVCLVHISQADHTSVLCTHLTGRSHKCALYSCCALRHRAHQKGHRRSKDSVRAVQINVRCITLLCSGHHTHLREHRCSMSEQSRSMCVVQRCCALRHRAHQQEHHRRQDSVPAVKLDSGGTHGPDDQCVLYNAVVLCSTVHTYKNIVEAENREGTDVRLAGSLHRPKSMCAVNAVVL